MEAKKRAWTYCRIDAPEDEHDCLKGRERTAGLRRANGL